MRFPQGKPGVVLPAGNKSGNTGAQPPESATPATPADPDLSTVLAAWPNLPPAIRAGILALIQATKATHPGGS